MRALPFAGPRPLRCLRGYLSGQRVSTCERGAAGDRACAGVRALSAGAPRRIPVVDGVREGLPVAVPGPVTLGDAVARGLPDAVGLGLLEAVGVGLRVVTGLAVPLGVRDAEHVGVPQRVPEATNSHRSGRGGGGFRMNVRVPVTPPPSLCVNARLRMTCRSTYSKKSAAGALQVPPTVPPKGEPIAKPRCNSRPSGCPYSRRGRVRGRTRARTHTHASAPVKDVDPVAEQLRLPVGERDTVRLCAAVALGVPDGDGVRLSVREAAAVGVTEESQSRGVACTFRGLAVTLGIMPRTGHHCPAQQDIYADMVPVCG